jgi:prepilin-type N-terminal cleavage/methylation domain-containing protein
MKRGFTLIETVVVMFIMVVLSVVAIASLTGRKRNNDLLEATQQIVTLLREAQSHAAAQDQESAWGVHFSNPVSGASSYALYYGSTYTAANVVAYYRLPADVTYSTASLPLGFSGNVVFAQISGAASGPSSLTLFLTSSNVSTTISVASSGAVSY